MPARRALVAEDSPLILMGLEFLLEQHGFAIVGPASTLVEACALARTETPDVAILDVNLHGELVFPAADQLLARGVPVVFTTGYAAEDALPPRYAGVPMIQKPFDARTLIAAVDAAITSGVTVG